MKADPVNKKERREFLKKSSVYMSGFPFLGGWTTAEDSNSTNVNLYPMFMQDEKEKSIIGHYGSWASQLIKEPASLSLRNPNWKNTERWREEAMAKTLELLACPDISKPSDYHLDLQYQFDGLSIEEVSWQLPFGNRTKAIILKPADVKGPLPGILALHDHGGKKYFGLRKITQSSSNRHPLIEEHQNDYYSGLAWANEIAKRGFVVLVHDVFLFASRRIKYAEVEGISWGETRIDDKVDDHPELPENIEVYNNWSGYHEHIMAKSLFCAGTTWPGVVLAEDRFALDILSLRDDVDSDRLGCGGLSGGGLRTVYLAGLDHRIKCAVCIGFMSTWRDFLMHKAFTHTWMTYTPLLSKYLEFPEIIGLRAPLPTLIQNNSEDSLYTIKEMKRSDKILGEVYKKAGAQQNYRTHFYPGGHKFDKEMQDDAFAWFEQWLTQ